MFSLIRGGGGGGGNKASSSTQKIEPQRQQEESSSSSTPPPSSSSGGGAAVPGEGKSSLGKEGEQATAPVEGTHVRRPRGKSVQAPSTETRRPSSSYDAAAAASPHDSSATKGGDVKAGGGSKKKNKKKKNQKKSTKQKDDAAAGRGDLQPQTEEETVTSSVGDGASVVTSTSSSLVSISTRPMLLKLLKPSSSEPSALEKLPQIPSRAGLRSAGGSSCSTSSPSMIGDGNGGGEETKRSSSAAAGLQWNRLQRKESMERWKKKLQDNLGEQAQQQEGGAGEKKLSPGYSNEIAKFLQKYEERTHFITSMKQLMNAKCQRSSQFTST